MALSRRSFLAGSLIVAVSLPAHAASATDGMLDAFVTVAPDGTVTVLLPSSEMGQGVSTSLPMIVAEELDADWSKVRWEHAPSAKPYRRTLGAGIEMQVTGGSQSIVAWRAPMAEGGARARAMLVRAAADRWGVDPAECTTEPHVVRCGERSASYGELAADAALLPPPRKVALKDPAAYRLVGHEVPRVDLHDKVTGKAVFGADVRLPGMRYATWVACPVFGGKVARVDDAACLAVPGVSRVLAFEEGVAVVADAWWSAKKGADALAITWDEGPNAELDSAAISRMLHEALDGRAVKGRDEGNARRALAEGGLEAVYEVPYLDHAPMEPLNCTVHVRPDAVEIWVPTQAQTLAEGAAVDLCGVRPEQVTVHTTLLGGGFGRRGQVDYVEQALRVGKELGEPVQLLWTREEQLRHGFYRPGFACRARGKVEGGRVAALHVRVSGHNTLWRWIPSFLRGLGPIQAYPMEGLLHGCPYGIEHFRVDWAPIETPVPIGFWRSVSYSHNVFFLESFLDELAHGAGADPVELRRSMLDDAPRYRAVLDRAVEAALWGRAPAGRFQGVALAESFGSLVAAVVEISMEGARPRVHRITAAVDCGPVVNPAIVRAQIVGGAVFGLSSALEERITLARGRVEQSTFAQYRLLRMHEAPEVDVHLVASDGPAGGIGEVGTPVVAPALCNAIFAATGRRIRRLPILPELETA